MKRRRLLYLKAVRYRFSESGDWGISWHSMDEKTDLEVRSIPKGTSHMDLKLSGS